MSTPVIRPADEIEYPYDDGKPVAESDFHFDPLSYARDALRLYFEERENVYVAGNLFLYYEEGNPARSVAPNIFVVIGAPKHDRLSYLLWKEPQGPDFVLEITSRSARAEDQGSKRRLYARLGVTEYWRFDPAGDYLDPPLQGLRLQAGRYRPMPAIGAALHSEVLGLDLRLDAGRLRFVDPATGRKLLTYREMDQARRQAEQARRETEQRAEEAERRARRLAERLRALGIDPENGDR